MGRMTDDEVQDYVYQKLFGDMDGLESKALFDEEDPESAGLPAMPEEPKGGMSGVSVEVKPLMAAADEGKPEEEEEDEDKLKGISSMSPLMERLHGKR